MATNNLARFNAARSRSRASWEAGSVDVSELLDLAWDLENAGPEMIERARTIVAKGSLDIVAGAKGRAPVDTGFLRSSIGATISRDGLEAQVGPSAAYGAFVELGTDRMSPQPYLGPAADEVEPAVAEAVAQLLEGLV